MTILTTRCGEKTCEYVLAVVQPFEEVRQSGVLLGYGENNDSTAKTSIRTPSAESSISVCVVEALPQQP